MPRQVKYRLQNPHIQGIQLNLPDPFARRGVVPDRLRLDVEGLEHKSHREFLST
jgi:hypothetical protein